MGLVVAGGCVIVVGVAAVSRCGEVGEVVDVADYGAIPDDGRDDSSAIQAALDVARRRQATTVQFAAGRYDVDTQPAGAGQYLLIRDARALTLRGNATELEFGDPGSSGLLVQRSRGVSVTGITFDYQTPPFAQGRIMGVDSVGSTIDVHVDNGFPPLDDPLFDSATWGTRHDAATGLLVMDGQPFWRLSIPDLLVAERTWRVQLTDGVGELAIGDGFVVPIHVSAAIFIVESVDTTITQVTVYGAPGAAFTSIDSDGTTILTSRVEPRPGAGRWISTTGGGLHSTGGRRGPVVQHSVFTRMLDDGVGINVAVATIEAIDARDQAEVDRRFTIRGGPRLVPGDAIEVFDPVRGVVRDRASISSVELISGDTRSLLLDRAIASVSTGSADRPPDQVFNSSESSSNFVVSENSFEAIRGRGVVVRTENGEVAENTFKDLPYPGVLVANDADWPVGNRPASVSIHDNVFSNVATAADVEEGEQAGAVVVAGLKTHYQFADSPLVGPVCVVGNVVRNASRHAVVVGSAAHVDVEQTTLQLSPDAPESVAAVVVRNSTDVDVTDTLVTNAAGATVSPAQLVDGAATTNGSHCDA